MFTLLVISGFSTLTTAAVVGISHSMALSAALLVKLTAHFIWHQGLEKTFIVIDTLKVTAITSTREVGFWVGSCNNVHKLTDADTGWTTMSRIFIEEVARAQQ